MHALTSFFILVIVVSSFSAVAKSPPKFSYTGVDKSLQITGSLCKYGRSSKTQLPHDSLQQIFDYLQQDEQGFIKQIENIKQGMTGHRLGIAKLATLYQTDLSRFNFDYYFEGNQTCVNYATEITLNFEQIFSQFISLEEAEFFSFLANPKDKTSILLKLQTAYPNISGEVVDANELENVKQLTPTLALYRFDYKKFLQSQNLNQSLFYIDSSGLLANSLRQYLEQNGFNQALQKHQAYWVLSITAGKRKNEFTVNYQNQAGQNILVKNDVDALPEMDADNEQEQLELIKLYLEMMELVEIMK